jgi:hypothetical protein
MSFDENVDYRAGVNAREQEAIESVASEVSTLGMEPGQVSTSEEWLADDRAAAEVVLGRFLYPTLVDSVHGIDFMLELRLRGDLLNRFRPLVAFLVSVQGEGWLDRENHGVGYHFHYLALRGRARTDVLLTFDPREPGPPDSLYWEHHGTAGKHADPLRWRLARIRAVFDAARPSLVKPGKLFFRPPSRSGLVLWRQ